MNSAPQKPIYSHFQLFFLKNKIFNIIEELCQNSPKMTKCFKMDIKNEFYTLKKPYTRVFGQFDKKKIFDRKGYQTLFRYFFKLHIYPSKNVCAKPNIQAFLKIMVLSIEKLNFDRRRFKKMYLVFFTIEHAIQIIIKPFRNYNPERDD